MIKAHHRVSNGTEGIKYQQELLGLLSLSSVLCVIFFEHFYFHRENERSWKASNFVGVLLLIVAPDRQADGLQVSNGFITSLNLLIFRQGQSLADGGVALVTVLS